MNTNIADMKFGMQEMRVDIEGMRASVQEMRDDAVGMKDSMQEMRANVKGMTSEMQEVKSEVQKLQIDVKELKDRVINIELTVENEIRVNIQRVAEGHLDLNRKLNEYVKLALDVDAKQEMQDMYIKMHDMKLKAMA